MTPEPKPARKLSPHQILIEKFVSQQSHSLPGFWPREMKIAHKLVKTYNLEFLLWVIPPYGKPVPSLAYFIADYGKQYLSEQFFNYKKATQDLSPKVEEFKLESSSIGENTVVSNKPKTLKDFLSLSK